jgi:hypothetical protein
VTCSCPGSFTVGPMEIIQPACVEHRKPGQSDAGLLANDIGLTLYHLAYMRRLDSGIHNEPENFCS